MCGVIIYFCANIVVTNCCIHNANDRATVAKQKLHSVEQQLVQANDAIANLRVVYDQLITQSGMLDAAHQSTTEAVVVCGNNTLSFVALCDRMRSCFPSKAMLHK